MSLIRVPLPPVRRRGVGQTPSLPSSISRIPQIGNAVDQIQQGQTIAQSLMSGGNVDPNMYLQIGYAFASAIGGEAGAVLTDVIGGASTGFAVAGPYGAVVGGVIGSIEGFSSIFNQQPQINSYAASKGTEIISGYVSSMASSKMPVGSTTPQGYAMAKYLSKASPPMRTPRPQLLAKYACGGDQSRFQCSIRGTSLNDAYAWLGCEPSDWSAGNNLDPGISPYHCGGYWDWWQLTNNSFPAGYYWTTINGGLPNSASAYKNDWIQATWAMPGLSQEEIVARAMARAPDPLWFAANIHSGWSGGSGPGGGGNIAYIWTPDLNNAMATTFMMRSVGASSRSILTELLIQAWVINKYGSQQGSLTQGANPEFCKPLWAWSQKVFHAYLDDVIAQVNAEGAGTGSTSLSTGSAVGAVLGGAALAGALGILGYSAYTKQSPVAVVQAIGSRIRRL